MSEEPTPALRRAPHTAWRELDGETVIADLRNKWMFGLSPAAGLIWHALDGRRDFVALLELATAQGYRGDLEEVESFLEEASSLGLVDEGSESGGRPSSSLRLAPSPDRLGPAEITWREDIRAFGQTSCGTFPATGAVCNQVPMT